MIVFNLRATKFNKQCLSSIRQDRGLLANKFDNYHTIPFYKDRVEVVINHILGTSTNHARLNTISKLEQPVANLLV